MRSFFSAIILLISIYALAFAAPQGRGYVNPDQQTESIAQRRQGQMAGGNGQQLTKEETAVGEIGEKIRQQGLETKKRETVGQKLDQGIEKVNETGKGIKENVQKTGEKIGEKVGETIEKANQTGQEIKKKAGDKVEQAGENIRSRRTVGQDIDQGIEKAKERGQGIQENVGEKVNQAEENIRTRRETVRQKMNEGILEARKKGTDLKENVGEKVDQKIRERRDGALGIGEGIGGQQKVDQKSGQQSKQQN